MLDDADLLCGQAEHLGQDALHAVHALTAGPQRVAPGGGIVLAEAAARLHRVGDDAVVDEVDGGDVRGLGEQAVDRGPVAGLPVQRHVAGGFRP